MRLHKVQDETRDEAIKNREKQRTKYWTIGVIAAVVVFGGVIARTVTDKSGGPAGSALHVTDVRQQAADFLRYHHSIVLTPQQEAIKSAALSAIPAPCCANYSIATCCCPCNLAKSVWGLAHFLVARRGYSAPPVKAAAIAWVHSSNPRGYSGDACYTRGCGRPFDHNGCGGMDEKQIS